MKKNIERILSFVASVIVLLIVALVIVFLFYGKTTEVLEPVRTDSSVYLSCQNGVAEEYPLLSAEDLRSVKFSCLIKFTDNRLENVFFEINGKFVDSNSAENLLNTLHANYDIYTGNHQVDRNSVVPTYTHIDDVSKMTVFTESGAIDDRVAPIIMMELDKLDDGSIEAITANYESKGFICKTK